ncbi:cupredoxin domain-containing protein [Granulicella arctica]|uniref:cupredoxin domain-containing protein n=1 Tax=Granulicella arctica TaxID=940613 RepID=UPI0021DF5EF8|nr:cupredoxin domain-containing protein [Granulicella arctica]
MPQLASLLTITWPLPADASAHGPALDLHLFRNLWIALGLFALAHLLLLIGLLRSRRGNPYGDDRKHLWQIEYLPLTALALLFIFLTVQAERLWAAARYTGADPAALQIEVTGMQFAWYFRYPGVDATFGAIQPQLISAAEGNPLGIDPADSHGHDDFITSELVLPAGREVDLRLHAQDVIHGFAIPEMRLKQNAVPGETVHIHFTPVTPGTYAILCTQLCGTGHYRMNANLSVLTPAAFADWLATHEKVQR